MARKARRAAARVASKKSAKRAGTSTKRTAPRAAEARRKPATRTARAKAEAAVNPALRGLALLTWTHGMTTALLADWPLDRLTFQCAGTDNHALWTMGHLTMTYSWLASLLDGRMTPVPENYNALFGMGSKPVADAMMYPPAGEVRHHFDATYARLTELASRITVAESAKPTVADAHGFARDQADVLDKAAWHEGWHSGQLSTLRRALGLKSVM